MSTSERTATTPAAPSTSVSARTSNLPIADLVARYGLLIVLAAVMVFFTFYGTTSEAFFTQANLTTIVGNQTVVCIIALAMVVPLTAGVLDLSLAATAGVSSVLCAGMLSRHDAPIWLGAAVGIGAGLLIGLLNATAVARYGLDPIIATLGVSILLEGYLKWYTDGMPITTNMPVPFVDFGSRDWLGMPRLVVVLVPVIAGTWYLLEHTPYGRYLHSVGSNRRAAVLVGIRVRRDTATSLVVAGGMAGLAGVLLCARAGGADPQTGPSYLFPALAAVFLGATAFRPGKPNPLGAVAGVFLVAFAVSGMTIAGASSWVAPAFNGAALLVAVGVSTFLGRRRGATR